MLNFDTYKIGKLARLNSEDGYYSVALWKNCQQQNILVHRMVLYRLSIKQITFSHDVLSLRNKRVSIIHTNLLIQIMITV